MIIKLILLSLVIFVANFHLCLADSDVICDKMTKSLHLKTSQIVLRHGARTPIFTPQYLRLDRFPDHLLIHPPDTYVPYQLVDDASDDVISDDVLREDNSNYFGRLTQEGALQAHNVGLKLKARYRHDNNLLTSVDDVEVHCTKWRRTVESARSLIAGLFGSEVKKKVRIRMQIGNAEMIAPRFNSCPFLHRVYNETWQDPDLVDGIQQLVGQFGHLDDPQRLIFNSE